MIFFRSFLFHLLSFADKLFSAGAPVPQPESQTRGSPDRLIIGLAGRSALKTAKAFLDLLQSCPAQI